MFWSDVTISIMGTFINKGNQYFKTTRNGEYVDKSEMISFVNKTLNTERGFSCVTRCRRFGKTMAANMLCAYYDKSCDSRELFSGLKIENDSSFDKHLNKYPVIYLDVTDFTTKYPNNENLSFYIQKELVAELLSVFDGIELSESDDLMNVLMKIVEKTNEKFIMIIDEWDAICRESEGNSVAIDNYVNLLRRLFKGSCSKNIFAGVYMTGILPIKKYKTQSALNNFREYSVVDPGNLAPYFGFLPDEVERLATQANMDLEDIKAWYDGYMIGSEVSVYNPWSVMEAVERGRCANYWSATGAYDSVSTYINMNYEGLKDDIIFMLGGGRCRVVTSAFENDPAIIKSKNDVLTILIHIGYLSYDWNSKECYIPNKEVREEMENAIKACNWGNLSRALAASEQLLADTLAMDESAVARGIDLAHDENTSILSYNNENSLSCVLAIAYYSARNDYDCFRELPSGRGFADLVFLPHRSVNTPALLVELKWNQSAETAIRQIHQKKYPQKIADYSGDILLVGINYDKQSKQHSCKIERFSKN